MIGYRIDQAKGLFFDAAAVMAATTKAERQVMSKFGAFVRTKARSSIRKRKAASPPGSPPSSHGNQLLKKNIYFVFEPSSRSVVVGPTLLGGKVGDAPAALEHGGATELFTGSKRRGTRKKKRVTVAARPFMQPAFAGELPKLDGLWANSIR